MMNDNKNTVSMIDVLKLKASKYYQDEMESMMCGKLFVEENKLKEFHKNINLYINTKFRDEFNMLNQHTYAQTLRECIKVVFDKVVEKNSLYRPKDTHAIGIDLGTTNSCVSYFKPSAENKFNCVIVPNELGHFTTASVVSIRDEEEEVVGDVAKEETYEYPKNTIISVKRLIGRRFNDESVQKSLKLWSYDVFDDGNNNPKIKVMVKDNEKSFYPEQISAKVLKKMKEISEYHLGSKVTKAVITVPAYFNDSQREATKDAAKIAGLEVMRIIDEPTAAAIAYRLNWTINIKPRNVLIYDMGGGTFDVAILTISESKVDVKFVGGDIHLGGDDFDTNIIKYCLEDFSRKYNETVESYDERALSRLRLEAEKCKIKLAGVERTNIHLFNFYHGKDLNVMLTRDKFEEINRTLIEKSMDLVLKTLSEAKLKTTEVDDIVLVGGSTRIQKIQGCLSELFGGRPLNHSVNPDEAVAVGAGIHAAMLNERLAVPLNGVNEPLSLTFDDMQIKGKFSLSFDIIKELGSGKSGRVIKVKEFHSKNYFAIKKIWIQSPIYKDQIENEIEMLRQLDSRFVIQLYDNWTEEEFYYIKMEPGLTDLRHFLDIKFQSFDRNDNSFDLLEYFISLQLFIELTECVEYLHSRNPRIIHRDLKPHNIVICEKSDKLILKLCDFGLSKYHEKSSHTQGVGTHKYMAPEVFKGRNYNYKVDIYSLGVIANEVFDIKLTKRVEKNMDYSPSDFSEETNLLFLLVSRMVIEDFEDRGKRPDCATILKDLRRFDVLKRYRNHLFKSFKESGFSDCQDNFFERYINHKISNFKI